MSAEFSKGTPEMTITSEPQLLLVLLDQQIAAWHIPTDGQPQRLPIEAQQRLGAPSRQSFVAALNDIQERLKGNELTDWSLHLIVDDVSRTLVSDSMADLDNFFQRPWQVLVWKWLQSRLELPSSADPWSDESLILGKLLPWLTAASDHAYRSQSQAELDARRIAVEEQQAKETDDIQQQLTKQSNDLRRKIDRLSKSHKSKQAELEEQHTVDITKLERIIERLQAQNAELKDMLANQDKPKRTTRQVAAKPQPVKKATVKAVAKTKPSPKDAPVTKAAKPAPKKASSLRSATASPRALTTLNSQAAWPFPTGSKP